MEQFSTTQLLTIKKILDRHMNHNVTLNSSAYQEIQNIIKTLTNSLIAK
jgi:hypothetical protein